MNQQTEQHMKHYLDVSTVQNQTVAQTFITLEMHETLQQEYSPEELRVKFQQIGYTAVSVLHRGTIPVVSLGTEGAMYPTGYGVLAWEFYPSSEQLHDLPQESLVETIFDGEYHVCIYDTSSRQLEGSIMLKTTSVRPVREFALA